MDNLDDSETNPVNTLLIVVVVILLILVFLIIIPFCCFREWMERIFPCLTAKITPEASSPWYHVERFGETRLKYLTYRMSNFYQEEASIAETEETTDTIQYANITLAVPVFEELLNTRVKARSSVETSS